MGIYGEDGSRIYSTGSVAQSGTAAIQYVTLTPEIVLPPGRYYYAWACDGTTSRAYFSPLTAVQGETFGLVQQTLGAIGTMPDLATFVAYAGQGGPFCGITRTASGF
jgi:hypothetical protein